MTEKLLQGHLDNACGFYSILNAISEVNGMSLARSKEVFKTFIRKYEDVSGRALLRGLYFVELREEILPNMMSLLKKDEQVSYSFPFASMRFNTMAEFADSLRVKLDPPSTAAVIGFGEPWHHWTTATHISDHAIVLKDSTEHSRKLFSSLALATAEKPYYPKNITLVHSRQTILFK